VCIPPYNASDPATFDAATGKPLRPDNFCQEAHSGGTDHTQHYTMVFNVFVLMQVFNEVNARKVAPLSLPALRVCLREDASKAFALRAPFLYLLLLPPPSLPRSLRALSFPPPPFYPGHVFNRVA